MQARDKQRVHRSCFEAPPRDEVQRVSCLVVPPEDRVACESRDRNSGEVDCNCRRLLQSCVCARFIFEERVT